MINKLKNCFDEMVVYKDLKKSNFFAALSLPSFLRDWILKRFDVTEEDFDGELGKVAEIKEFISQYLPRKEEWVSIKDRIVVESERVKILTKILIEIDIKTQDISFALPMYGLTHKQTVIEPSVWDKCKDELLSGVETWGVVELGYRMPEGKTTGKIKLISFKNFCPYRIDIDDYKDARNEFTVDEWIDVLLGAVDYNAAGYKDKVQKLALLTRLLPFVEKRLNLIELAPKGTGKSYLMGNVSRYGYLLNGGKVSRAKLFYDVSRRSLGLIFSNDYLALDEIQSISCDDIGDTRSALKGYMEQGVYNSLTGFSSPADCGVVLLGNILQDRMDIHENMFDSLPQLFQESALLDRFHGFIKGWDIPRMNDDLKVCGWALNSEYFTAIAHLLRDDASYRSIIDVLIDVPEKADTRDTEAVKRIATAYLKLLFPNVRKPSDISMMDFNTYCLKPAVKMRGIILLQLGMMDVEYKGKTVPSFTIREV